MSQQRISRTKRARVERDSQYRCGYCLTSQRIIGPFLEIDHIIPEARGGTSADENLILACPMCNSRKSDQVAAIDPITQEITPLFHPRRDVWSAHFEWAEDGAVIRGKTAIGRATVAALDMNHPDIVSTRRLWISVGWHPPANEDE
jgi:hypothetical protein